MLFKSGDETALVFAVAETAAQKQLPGCRVEVTKAASGGLIVIVTPPELDGEVFMVPADSEATSVASGATAAATLAAHKLMQAAGRVSAGLLDAANRSGHATGYEEGKRDAITEAELSSVTLLTAQVNDLHAELSELRDESMLLHSIKRMLENPHMDYAARVLAARDLIEGRTSPAAVVQANHPVHAMKKEA